MGLTVKKANPMLGLHHLFDHQKLTKEQAYETLTRIGKGDFNNSQIAAFLTVFLMRNISADELSGFQMALLDLCLKMDFSDFNTIDVCGTGGDGKDTWPFSDSYAEGYKAGGHPDNDNLHYDLAKLHEWDMLFKHMQERGMHLFVVFGEAETNNKLELYDHGTGEYLNDERQQYYREMIARFSHYPAVTWLLSEEYNGDDINIPNEEVLRWGNHVKSLDWAEHGITAHVCCTAQQTQLEYRDWDGSGDGPFTFFGPDSPISLVSIQDINTCIEISIHF